MRKWICVCKPQKDERVFEMKKFLILIFTLVIFTPMLSNAAPQKANKVGYINITYETKDSFVIKSKLFYPAKKQPVYPAVVLLHSLGYSSDYWGSMVKQFVDAGAAVILVDLRGHGQSTYDSNFKIRSWVYYSEKSFAKYPEDVSEILKYIASDYKNISTTKYAIVGADIGANTAILTAERIRQKPACMVLLSPTRLFNGLYTPISMTNIGAVPILSIVSVRDPHSVKESDALKKFAQGTFEIKPYPAGGMGMLMLKANPSMNSDIVNWVMPKLK